MLAIAYNVEETKVSHNFGEFGNFLNSFGDVFSVILALAIFLYVLAQAVVLGLDATGAWKIPGVTGKDLLIVTMSISAFVGLLGRGLGLTYFLITAGVVIFVIGSFPLSLVVLYFIGGPVIAGYLVNRFVYLLALLLGV